MKRAEEENFKEFEKKDSLKLSESINIIDISSDFTDVNLIFSGDEENMHIHLHGRAETDGEIFYTVLMDSERNVLKINIQYTGTQFCGESQLDITLPKWNFKLMSIRTRSGNVNGNFYVKAVYVWTDTGDVDLSTSLQEATISTLSGNIRFVGIQKSNLFLDFISSRGNIDMQLKNIVCNKIFADSLGGKVSYKSSTPFPKESGHCLHGSIYTGKGNILVHFL